MWFWVHVGVGSDFVPFPTAGGSGVITSVTLPAMTNPGPMQVVVLTGELRSTGDPAHAESICCQVKQIGPTFTVPANQVTTVPQNLAVSAQKEANVSIPGETSLGDIAAISVLSETASVPLKYTGPNAGDFDSVYLPAPTATNGEFIQPGDPPGYQLLARFNLGATPAPAPLRRRRRPAPTAVSSSATSRCRSARTARPSRLARPPTRRPRARPRRSPCPPPRGSRAARL